MRIKQPERSNVADRSKDRIGHKREQMYKNKNVEEIEREGVKSFIHEIGIGIDDSEHEWHKKGFKRPLAPVFCHTWHTLRWLPAQHIHPEVPINILRRRAFAARDKKICSK